MVTRENHQDDAPETLDADEIFWADLQPWLRSTGYELRRRYRPSWVPSWKQRKTSLFWWEFEDSLKAKHPSVMDAKRTVDGSSVMLKKVRVSDHPMEVELTKYLASELKDEKNHSPDLIDVLTVPEDHNMRILVFPLLRRFDDPEFDAVIELIEFLRQIIEGVQFLHHNRIAHRDIGVLNIMMDTSMYPDGFHPAAPSKTPDFREDAKHIPRNVAHPRYFLIDFGLAVRYEYAELQPRAVPVRGQDKTVPEFAAPGGMQNAYDPFPTDIYYLGNFIREHFFEGKDDKKAKLGLEFLRPLVEEMCSTDPSKRPDIDAVSEKFSVLAGGIPHSRMKARLKSKDEGMWESMKLGTTHAYRKLKYKDHE
ncbi:hypothetical protein CYLTODRAFT_381577 [Cylindrobasidium torrendii FP15055 ss-10]|uniref:Protein kinase domain-containing protein n=1 Tax=Cylindrobasidium torrendii FP15055 ss-10 TaxID=1314674 RepID=A0A0D7B0C8_9AGAR|nr:hypothetical protein CYLTODRAFT_381577 [Cylindrobasidium torrendii FP15055 ss-10]